MISPPDRQYDRRRSSTSCAATSPCACRGNAIGNDNSTATARKGPAEPQDAEDGSQETDQVPGALAQPGQASYMASPATTVTELADPPTPDLMPCEPTEQQIKSDIHNYLAELMEPGGPAVAKCYRDASETPPITADSLTELDIPRIINNPKLRHDVNFDRELHFRPNLDGSKGKQKLKQAKDFWRALEGELFIYAFVLDRRARDEDAHNDSYWHLVMRENQKRLPKVFAAISEILKTLVPDADQKGITDRLDVDLIMQQIERGMCDYVELAQWLAKVLTAHCAPMRDELVNEMRNAIVAGAQENDLEKLVSGLRQLLLILEHMKLDVANHQIRHMRPLLVEDTVNFQQKYNAHRIDLGKIDSRNAKLWFDKGLKDFAREGGSPSNIDALAATLLRDLLYSNSNSFFPGTFYLDNERLRAVRVDLFSSIYLHICSDIFRELAGESIPHSLLSKTVQELESRVCDIVGGSARFGDRIEFIASEIVRLLLAMEGRSQQIDPLLLGMAEQKLVMELRPNSTAFHVHAQKLTSRLRPKLLRSIKSHQNESAVTLQEALVPGVTPPPQTSASILGFGATLLPPEPSEPSDPDADVVRRFTHMVVLHWHVWADLVYLRQPEDDGGSPTPPHPDLDAATCSSSSSVSDSSSSSQPSTASSSPMMPLAEAIYGPDHKFLVDKIVLHDHHQPIGGLPTPASSPPPEHEQAFAPPGEERKRGANSRQASYDDHPPSSSLQKRDQQGENRNAG